MLHFKKYIECVLWQLHRIHTYTHSNLIIWPPSSSSHFPGPSQCLPFPLSCFFLSFFSSSSFSFNNPQSPIRVSYMNMGSQQSQRKMTLLAASSQLLIAPQSPFPVRAGIIDWAGLGQVTLGAVSQWCHPWLCCVQRQRVRALLPSVPFPCSLNLRVGKDVTQHCSLLPLCLRTLNSLSLCNGFFQINF